MSYFLAVKPPFDILAGRYVYGIYNSYSGAKVSAGEAYGVTVVCPTGNSGCRAEVDHWGLQGGTTVILIGRFIDTVYSYYFSNDLAGLYRNHGQEFKDGFPGIESERPGAIDSILSGNYGLKVLADSSIVILQNPNISKPISVENIIFAMDRDKLVNQN